MSAKVSIIIPVYNAENTVTRCVESLLFGVYQNFEIILVEDGSIDHSWKVCQLLAAKYTNITAFHNEINKGVSFTRNVGLQNATGDLIIFVDCDDWVSGDYLDTIVLLAEQNPDKMIITGYYFIDYVNQCNKLYRYSDDESCNIGLKNLFELHQRVLLQQLWNKSFDRTIIEEYHIRFDEEQCMGEDFQFVLDYLEASGIEQFVVCNRGLYYYIRANENSLMSKFGFVENLNEYKRLNIVQQLCGLDSSKTQELYQDSIKRTKQSFVYRICRDPSYTCKKKIAYIQKVLPGEDAKTLYKAQKKMIAKEKIVFRMKKMRALPERVRGHIARKRRDFLIEVERQQLLNKDFTIISQNCIGGVFYHDMGLKFSSPTINLYFLAEDFVKFTSHLQYYLSLTPIMHWDETYPIGILDDITIRFMHYHTCSEALELWERRKLRINWDNIIVFSTDMEGFSEKEFEVWKKLPYKKILFTAQKEFSLEKDSLFFPEYEEKGCVCDLIPKREFYKNNIVMDIINMK